MPRPMREAAPAPAPRRTRNEALQPACDERSTGIYGNLVSATGSLARANGFPICTAAIDQFTPAVAALGTNYLVAWQDARDNPDSTLSDIYGARLDAGDPTLVQPEIVVSGAAHAELGPALAWNGTLSLAVWSDHPQWPRQRARRARRPFGPRRHPLGPGPDSHLHRTSRAI